MSGCQTHIVPTFEDDPCLGDKKSTKCVLDENAFIELNLPANSTQEEINAALYQSLQAQALVIESQQNQIDELGDSTTIKTVQVLVTQADILNASGFAKLLVAPTTGKILVPVSISAYRKPSGTAYSIPNSVRLTSVAGSSSGTVGSGSIDSVFQNATPHTTIAPVSTSNFALLPGNSLHVVSGSFTAPSVITGGTGDLIVFLTYTEITV